MTRNDGKDAGVLDVALQRDAGVGSECGLGGEGCGFHRNVAAEGGDAVPWVAAQLSGDLSIWHIAVAGRRNFFLLTHQAILVLQDDGDEWQIQRGNPGLLPLHGVTLVKRMFHQHVAQRGDGKFTYVTDFIQGLLDFMEEETGEEMAPTELI